MTALTKQDEGDRQVGYAAAMTDAAEIIRENLGGDAIDMGQLPRVTVPAGGGVAWEVPTPDGWDSIKALSGIVIHQQSMRAYWAQGLEESGGGSPPDCRSDDGITGEGTPGGDCATCPLNQFGSDKDERGKACKEVKVLFLLREGELLPTMVRIPPSSLKAWKNYMLGLANQRQRYHTVETTLTLEKVQNQGNITYAQVAPKKGRDLTDEERAAVAAAREQFLPILGQYLDAQREVAA